MKLVIGALFGAGSALLFLFLIGEDGLESGTPSWMISVVAGLSYFLIGILVGFGVIAPRVGAQILEVEDAEEIREQRRILATSAIACALIGLFLLALALAPVIAGPRGRSVVLIILGLSLAAVIVIGATTSRKADELIRQISLEASAWTLQIGLVVMAAWAALAHLDYIRWVDPLGLLSGAALLHLFAIFAISGQKGLMRPR